MSYKDSSVKSNYKKLGSYIRIVNLRNSALEKLPLLGVSIRKCFMPSIANTVGTDMSTYKIILDKQFSYGPVTSRNGDKISVAFMDEHKKGLVYQAYTVFEVIDFNLLDPEYLMMWFRRPEFDRYARYKSHGSAREIFDWEEMCETELPIPSIEKQREIVKEYNTVVDRIQLNEKLNQKLEETAQAIYKEWFMDFEFPNEDGKPYRSSGGEMVWCDGLDKEIPAYWKFGCLDNISAQFSGFSFKGELYSFEEGISVVRGENVTEQRLRWDTHKKWNLNLDIRMKKCFLESEDIVIGMDGSKVGKNWSLISPYDLPLLLAQRVTSIRGINEFYSFYLFLSLRVLNFEEYVSQVQTGTSVPHISGQQIKDFPLMIIDSTTQKTFHLAVKPFFEKLFLNIEFNKKLESTRNLLLSKMSKIENELIH